MSGEAALLEAVFIPLFARLREVGYAWPPLSPEKLQKCRAEPERFGAYERFFGLGLETPPAELPGIPAEVLRLRPAVSTVAGHFVPHTHWGGGAIDVYASEESVELARWTEGRLSGARVLELGSGAGAVAFALASRAGHVLGIDSSSRAVEWASAAARAQRIGGVEFRCARVGTPEAAEACAGRWDAAVFNAPMTIPVPGQSREHRDGGRLGLEVPLLFLEHARACGVAEASFLATNPIVRGRGELFERLEGLPWSVEASERLHPRFNQALYRKEKYAEQGIERIELWAMRLSRR